MRPRTITFLLALAVIPLAVVTLPSHACASVSIAVTWEGLLRESSAAALMSPIESRSVWESGRIYSYTRLRVDRTMAGDIPAGEVWVRTIGGVVGKIGQLVEGEPVLVPGEQSLLFVRPGPIGAWEVTARGQGQFPIVGPDAKAPAHVIRAQTTGLLVAPQFVVSSATIRLAADVLHGRSVEDVAGAIASDWSRLHAHP